MVMYDGDNSDQFVPMADYTSGSLINRAGGFWGGSGGPGIPNSDAGTMTAAAQAQLMTNNPLAQYAKSPGVYECPGDTRYKVGSLSDGWAYGSYSKTENVGGEPYQNYYGANNTCKKFSDVQASSSTFMFTEDCQTTINGRGPPSSGYNLGTWVITWNGTAPSYFTWEDPVPQYHGNVSTYAFTDGHAEYHKWLNAAVILNGKLAAAAQSYNVGYVAPGGDQDYMHNGYRFPGWK